MGLYRLGQLPEFLCELPQLQALNLNDTPLNGLPKNLAGWKNLRALSLFGTGIQPHDEQQWQAKIQAAIGTIEEVIWDF